MVHVLSTLVPDSVLQRDKGKLKSALGKIHHPYFSLLHQIDGFTLQNQLDYQPYSLSKQNLMDSRKKESFRSTSSEQFLCATRMQGQTIAPVSSSN